MFDALFLSFIMLLFGSIHFFYIYTQGKLFLMSDVCFWVTAFSVGSGPVLAYINGAENLPGIEEMLWVYIAFFLYFLGLIVSKFPFRKSALLSPFFTRKRNSPLFYFTNHILDIPLNVILSCFAIVVLIKMYMYSIGGGISGMDNLDIILSKNYLIVISEFLSDAFPLIITFFSFVCLFKHQYMKYALVMLIVMLIMSMLDGRRAMIYFMINIFFVTIAFYGKFNIRYFIFGLVGLYFVFNIFSPLYLAFRLNAQTNLNSDMNTIKIIGLAISETIGGNSDDENNQINRENLKDRGTTILTVVNDIVQAENRQEPLMGDAFLQGQENVLPRILRGGLEDEGTLNPKVYMQQRFGFVQGDATYSLVAEGVADFGIIGGLFAGLLMGLFVNFLTLMALKTYQTIPLIGMVIFANAWSVSISAETNPGFQGTMIRNIILISLIMLFLKKIGIRMTNRKNDRHTPIRKSPSM
jgi:hypothetical protein